MQLTAGYLSLDCDLEIITIKKILKQLKTIKKQILLQVHYGYCKNNIKLYPKQGF